MDKLYRKIRKLWKNAPQYYWGDPLDVRFYLSKKLMEIKNKKILDVGCGPGIIINCLDKTNKVYGIDNNKEVLKIAQKINPNFKLVNGDIFNSNFEDNFFDIIILAHVLPKQDYASDRFPEELINHLERFLKPRGQIFLTTPNAKNACYRKGNKFVDEDYLEKLLRKDFDYKIYGWNPFPAQSGHLLKYIPGIFNLLEWLSKKEIRKTKCITFYVEATLK